MKPIMVPYNGRMVPKDGFRTFVYNVDGEQNLAESWNQYECLVQTGVWFSSKELAKEKQKLKKKGD